jgi:CubicO group peptidase (beta-lactamase class C family)
MTATGFPPLPAQMTARCATGYQWRALSDYLDPAPPMPPVWAEGGLWSCVEDLARWVSFQLRAYREPGATAPVLGAASLREMHRPRYLADDRWTQAWGISWCGTRRDDAVWIGHGGGIPGFTSAICFDPAAQVGAVVLLNGTSSSAALAMDLAALGRDLTRHRLPSGTPPAPEPAPENYQPLLGIYARPSLGGWLIRLEWTHGTLAFTTPEAPDWQVVLTPAPVPDHFTIVQPGNLSGENVTFHRLADGRVASVQLMDSTWVRLDRVTT